MTNEDVAWKLVLLGSKEKTINVEVSE